VRKSRSHSRLCRAEYRELGMWQVQEHANLSPFKIETLSKWKDSITSEAYVPAVIKGKMEKSQEERAVEIVLTCLHLLNQEGDNDALNSDFVSEDIGSEDESWDRLMMAAEEVATLSDMESELATVSLKQRQMKGLAIFEIAKEWAITTCRDMMSEDFPRFDSPYI
jgi:hypothetical protein